MANIYYLIDICRKVFYLCYNQRIKKIGLTLSQLINVHRDQTKRAHDHLEKTQAKVFSSKRDIKF